MAGLVDFGNIWPDQYLKRPLNVIGANPAICDYGLQDLSRAKGLSHRQGAHGMSADQVLRCALVKTLFGFTYEELAFHLVDSQSISGSGRIGIAEEGLTKSALNKAKSREIKDVRIAQKRGP